MDQREYDDKLSFGNYIGKQIYQQVVIWGSVIGGAYTGLFTGKNLSKTATPITTQAAWGESFFARIPGLKNVPTKMQVYGGLAGAAIGSIFGGLVLGYEHWRKEKTAQMQVEEITRDISDIELFKKTDPELQAENKRLWAELEKREKQHHGPKKEGSWQERAHHEHAEHAHEGRA